jgi:hypothetical protein
MPNVDLSPSSRNCWIFALAAWFKQAYESNASIDGTHLKEKTFSIAAHLGIANFSDCNEWINRCERRHNIVCETMAGENRSVYPETVEDWKSYRQLEEIEGCNLRDMHNADGAGLFFSLPRSKLSLYEEILPWCYKSKQQVILLFACNADGSDKLPPLVIGKCTSPRCFKNGKRLPTEYKVNTNSWMTTKVFEDYLTQLDRKLGAQNHTVLIFVDQCGTYPKNTTFLSNSEIVFLPANCTSQLQPLDLEIIHAFKCCFRKQLIWKTSHDRWGTAPRCYTDEAAMHLITEAWRLITSTAIKNCLVKCGFSIDHVICNHDSPLKLSEDEEDDWHTLQPLPLQFEDYTICDYLLS